MARKEGPSRSGAPGVDRRSFVSGAVVAGAAAPLSGASSASAGEQMAAAPASPAVSGADFMVDVLRSLNIEYCASNPASSFRAIHESILNYAGNQKPEFLTCLHEESSVAMCHGYAKASGRPMLILAHSTVGLQHASMAIYNAWCDRVPAIVIIGNIKDATVRRPGIEWSHTAQDPVSTVRDFVKWDDQPASLQHFAESLVRAYKIAMTPPMGPVVIVADVELQEMALKNHPTLRVPKLSLSTPPQGDGLAVAAAAKALVATEKPVIVVDRLARTANGMSLLVQLAELVGAPVVDQLGRLNFPMTHPLSQNERNGALLRAADLVLALEVGDRWGMVYEKLDNEEQTVTQRTRAKVISISSADLYLKSNFQDFQRYAEDHLSIAGDGEATLPALIEAVRLSMTDAARSRATTRIEEQRAAKIKSREATLAAAAVGWNASPIATARLCAEIWEVIKNEDWSMVSDDRWVSYWPRRLWPFDRHDRFIGNSGGYGVGYGFPAAVGAALAFRSSGKMVVNIQSDGDLLYAPGALWTAVHHKIPLLTIMHNNRAYHQEMMHVQRMANRHNRGVDQAHIGTTMRDPFINFSKLAESMGMWAEGPVTDPAALNGALKRALKVVKSGMPALVDVITQPR